MSREQCAFTQAQEQPQAQRPGETDVVESTDPGWAAEPGWARVDEILRFGVEYLGGGTGAVESVTERWCAETPNPATGEGGMIWVCVLDDPPRLGGHELSLEFDQYALFSLTGFGYTRAEGSEMLKAARTRWAKWCASGAFAELESLGAEEFHRCALSEGPTFVLGRFSRDLDADLWQVSLAVIGAG